MKITLHDESIDVEVGDKVIFYEYFFNDTNELDVRTDETYVDLIDEKNNKVGFKNDVHSATLFFYQRDVFGERFFLSHTKENRLRYLKSNAAYYESCQKMMDNCIKDTYNLLENYIKQKEDIENNLESLNKLIKQVEGE